MDQTMVDVSRIKGIRAGERVVLMGKSGAQSIHAEDIAKLAGTIGYEVVCSLGGSIRRFYKP